MKPIRENEWELTNPKKQWIYRDDKNHNGIADRTEDRNHNGIPDGLERPFGRSDFNHNGIPDGLEVPMDVKLHPHHPHHIPHIPHHPHHTPHHFKSANEKRLKELSEKRRDEAYREKQIERLQDYRNALAVRDAAEYGRAVALREAERDYRIKQSEFIEQQLNEVNAMNHRMNDQYQKIVDEVIDITARLSHPENLFPESFIKDINFSEDYVSFVYSDGRRVSVRDSIIGLAIDKHLAGIKQELDCLIADNTKLAKQLHMVSDSNVELQTKLAETNSYLQDIETRLSRLGG